MILKYRNRGAKVKELQKLLGLYPDGIFGKNTLKKVKDFQRDNRLKVDGIVGPNTWAILVKSFKNKVKPTYNTDLREEETTSDPHDRFEVDNIDDHEPYSEDVSEIIALIENSNISRNIERLVFHTTATTQSATVSAIVNYWKNTLGWRAPGYHVIIRPDGNWTQLLDFNKISNGVRSMNSKIINVSYIGGVDRNGNALDNRTKKQNDVLEAVYRTFKHKLPNITFHGHNEFSTKACPSFNVKRWLNSLD